MRELPAAIADWLAAKGWALRSHQQAMLEAAEAGEHVMLVAATGAGKTLAGFLPTLADLILRQAQEEREGGLHTIYVSPLKALAVDVQRNLLGPLAEMNLDIRVETRTGDTPSDRKARQREKPPQILLTTPESLSLLISYVDSDRLLASVRTVIVDEVHAFATSKRGDLLALTLSRLQRLAPGLRRVGLSATIADPEAYQGWLAPDADPSAVRLVVGDAGAEPDIGILTPGGQIPWSGHSGRHAVPQLYELMKAHRTTLVFCNTRGLAELIFQDLWTVNEDQLPIGIHHGSLSVEARRKAENAMAEGKLRGLVCTASLDLGVDWGDIDLVVQMGAPKGSSRLLQRIGRANHRLDEPSKALIAPGNRFEWLEARAALDAVAEREFDAEYFRPGALDVLAQHLMACACSGPFQEDAMYGEVRAAAPYAGLPREMFDRTLAFIETGGYALRAYDRYKRLTKEAGGMWRVSHPRFIAQHRLNAGIIVEATMVSVRFKNGRSLGKVEEYFASMLSPGDAFHFAGMTVEVERMDGIDLIVKASVKSAQIPSYLGARLALTTHLAGRVRQFLASPGEWARFPDPIREWLEVQRRRSRLPQPGELMIETFPHEGRHYMVAYSFEGWNAHQSLGMLLTRRMETAGLKPLGFQANDYALACWSLEPVTDPAALFSADILEGEFVQWVQSSHLLKRAFREVAVIGGLVERQQPGQKKTGKQVTFSTDLIYDVLQRWEPDHMLLRAAWEDAKARLTDVGRLANLLDRAAGTIVHQPLERVSPLAVPVLIMIGRESVAQVSAEDAMLIEANELAAIAMA